MTVISGCSEKASWGASGSRPVAPEQWPDDHPGRDRRGGGRDLTVGNAQQNHVASGGVRAAAQRSGQLEVVVPAERGGDGGSKPSGTDDRDPQDSTGGICASHLSLVHPSGEVTAYLNGTRPDAWLASPL